MSDAAPRRGLKSYLGTLAATILVPLLWMRALGMARDRADDDPRARAKVLAAIGASIAIALVGTSILLGFLASAQAGMYDSLDGRLAQATGETEYQDQLTAIESANSAIPNIEAALANATDANRARLQETLNQTRADLQKAQARSSQLEANHAQYERISAAVQRQDDTEAKRLIATAPAYDGKDAAASTAFEIKDRAVRDMWTFSLLFLWPSLLGAFFAPLAFALGSILARAFVPSDTVGYKPYPGAAAGLFLLFGAFGLPSLLFAAWTFNDAFNRSAEGQIAL